MLYNCYHTYIFSLLAILWQLMKSANVSSNLPDAGLVAPLTSTLILLVNILRPRQNSHHFPDDVFKCIFLSEIVVLYFDGNFMEICSIGSNKQYSSIGPDNNCYTIVTILIFFRC